jgi:hypothetical protein
VRWACIALWLCACSRAPASDGASVRVVVAARALSGAITRVSVSVAPGDAAADLARGPDGTFSGTLGVPVGALTVTATAWSGTVVVGSGSGSITVSAGQTAQLFIAALDTTGPPPLPDHSPVITSLAASATAVAVGDQLTLAATAVDADADPITFGWSAAPAECGTFAAPTSSSTTWTAAAVGPCVVTITASARGQSDSRSTSILVSAAVATPTLVQHVSSSTNPVGVGIPGNDFKFTLPNRVGAGNCLILGMSYAWSSTRTVSVSDDNGNSWPAAPAATTNDGGTLISSIFVLPNAHAGVTTITVTFDDDLLPFQYTISEFYNVATASPVNGKSASSATVSPNLSSGTFTPTTNNDASGGNLIWSYFCDLGGGTGNWTTTFAAGANFTLLDADIAWHQQGLPHASQYTVQTTQAAINPGMTATMTPANDTYNALSVALRAAPAGTAPPAGIRIIRVSHFTNEVPPAAWDLQFPSSGNLIVLATSETINHEIVSITDSENDTYVLEAPDDTEPQIWFAANTAPDPARRLTINFTGTVVGTSVAMYDVTGADPSPLDGVVGVTAGEDPGGANLHDMPSITPASIGLTIAVLTLGQGPSIGLDTGSPAGAIFDLVTYAGETDLDTMENADGKAHLYNSDLSQENWNWVIGNGGVTTGFAAIAVHFKAAATPPVP